MDIPVKQDVFVAVIYGSTIFLKSGSQSALFPSGCVMQGGLQSTRPFKDWSNHCFEDTRATQRLMWYKSCNDVLRERSVASYASHGCTSVLGFRQDWTLHTNLRVSRTRRADSCMSVRSPALDLGHKRSSMSVVHRVVHPFQRLAARPGCSKPFKQGQHAQQPLVAPHRRFGHTPCTSRIRLCDCFGCDDGAHETVIHVNIAITV